jgi:hypothetical protein
MQNSSRKVAPGARMPTRRGHMPRSKYSDTTALKGQIEVIAAIHGYAANAPLDAVFWPCIRERRKRLRKNSDYPAPRYEQSILTPCVEGLEGCPTFASAYVGRKRGALAPSNAFAVRKRNCPERTVLEWRKSI